MSLVSLRGIVKNFRERPILDRVDLSISANERLALIGGNGSGKSTLLSILAGQTEADEGERAVQRGLRIAWLEQEPRLEPHWTIREAVQAASEEREQHEVEEVLSRLELGRIERTCGTLSGGERRRVDLARALVARPGLLLLDEPTNHLDAFTTDWLEDHLLATRTPFVLVTHDRYFLDRVVTRICELDRGQLHFTEGGYSDYLEERSRRLGVEAQNEASRQILLRRETAWMRRGAPARTTKAKARISRYEALVQDAPIALPRELELAIPEGPRLGSRVVAAHGISKSLGGRELLRKLDLELAPGEKLAVVGPNGAGKSTLLRILMGTLEPDSGRVDTGETVRFASVAQNKDTLDPAKTVAEEIAGRSELVRIGERELRVESFLDGFLFPGPQKRSPIGKLSGGEKSRVLLAKLLIQGGNVLVLDEPTNDLDLATLRALEEALLVFPGSCLIVSHDRWFVDRVANRILYLDGEGGARLHSGDLSSLLETLSKERSAARGSETKTAARTAPTEAPVRRRGLAPWQQREYDGLLERIAAAEAAEKLAASALEDPGLYTGPRAVLAEKQAAHQAAQQQLEQLLARWEELESLR
jgi:ATP-binding cassette subfamily F protein uup